MLAEDYIQHTFETEILPALFRFVKKFHTQVEQKVIQGEFFTLIRRHLPDLTKEKATYSISLKNIDIIGVSRDGDIISIGFSKGDFCRYSRTHETVDTLNKILKSSNMDYSKSILGHNLDLITESLRYIQF